MSNTQTERSGFELDNGTKPNEYMNANTASSQTELREEYKEFCKPMYGKSISAVGEIETAHWWLNKLTQATEQARKKIQKEIDSTLLFAKSEKTTLYESGYRAGLEKALLLIRPR